MRTDVFFEWAGKQIDQKLLVETAKETWKSEGNKVKDLESLDLYCKPEEGKCYYIFNGTIKGEFLI